MGYKVNKGSRWMYIPPFNVETYVRAGFDLYKEQYIDIENVEETYNNLTHMIDFDNLPTYWAEKDGIRFKIQPFRMLDFYNRGYSIKILKMTKISDIESEIEIINASDGIVAID